MLSYTSPLGHQFFRENVLMVLLLEDEHSRCLMINPKLFMKIRKSSTFNSKILIVFRQFFDVPEVKCNSTLKKYLAPSTSSNPLHRLRRSIIYQRIRTHPRSLSHQHSNHLPNHINIANTKTLISRFIGISN